MLLTPEVLTLLILNIIFAVFAIVAFVLSVKIFLNFDINSTSKSQYMLEKQSYLSATIIKYIFAIKVPLFLFFIFTLDKISNVLLSKQALQAAEGAGVVATSTAVFGTQVARIEEYGISNNPESFAAYGDSRYFTDTSRGAVIQLKGTGGIQDKLTLISELGMRSYFRDNSSRLSLLKGIKCN